IIDDRETLRPRWWFGGIAATCVACVVAPFDLVKTHMQTQRRKKGMFQTAIKGLLPHPPAGYRGFYDGFMAGASRQMVCTSMRFTLYEFGKDLEIMHNGLGAKILVASVAGSVSSIIGMPLDVINVRMQNDMKGEEHLRRNYKGLGDALMRIPAEEGLATLYNGGSAAVLKAAVGTIGQIAVYDQVKGELRKHFNMEDDFALHFKSSLISSIIDAIITQPFDVLKTLRMNARPGQFPTTIDALKHMLRFGYGGLYRGLMPTLVRKVPAMVLMYIIYEQLRINLGYPEYK
ncbi:hypothetical protein KR222_002196, partial [Zaprionus bogoriensis]